MIKLLHTLFLSSILIICNDAISQIVTTDNFLNYTTADGLITNEIKDILIQDSSNVWIGTPSGLSHFDGTTFTSYTAANSGLNNDNIKE